MPDPIGYICALTDPDGNMIEFSYDQGVYEKAQEVWGRWPGDARRALHDLPRLVRHR